MNKLIQTVAFLVLAITILGCEKSAVQQTRSTVVPRIVIVETSGYGAHFFQLVRIDGKEYVINNQGGIIEHKAN